MGLLKYNHLLKFRLITNALTLDRNNLHNHHQVRATIQLLLINQQLLHLSKRLLVPKKVQELIVLRRPVTLGCSIPSAISNSADTVTLKAEAIFRAYLYREIVYQIHSGKHCPYRPLTYLQGLVGSSFSCSQLLNCIT